MSAPWDLFVSAASGCVLGVILTAAYLIDRPARKRGRHTTRRDQ